jgi:hypothetical protein
MTASSQVSNTYHSILLNLAKLLVAPLASIEPVGLSLGVPQDARHAEEVIVRLLLRGPDLDVHDPFAVIDCGGIVLQDSVPDDARTGVGETLDVGSAFNTGTC